MRQSGVPPTAWQMLRARRPGFSAFLEDPFARLRLAVLLAVVVTGIGTAGFMAIERYGFVDALYMTAITLSTVGYETVRPLDGPGKLFVIGLITVGLVMATWVLSTVVEVLVSPQAVRIRERRHMEQLIGQLSGHYILCGFGRIGRQITQEYLRNNVPFVVVDIDSGRIDAMGAHGLPHVFGDASDEEVLRRAGIDRAAGLIAVTPTDAVNTFIVLTARGLRDDLFIVARADAPHNVEKLYRAGASKVVSPHTLGGRWMGATAVNPAVTDFITAMTDMDHATIQIREMTIGATGEIRGRTFSDTRLRERTGALVVAVRTAGGEFIPNPPDDYLFQASDILVAMGSPVQLAALARLADPTTPLAPLAVGRSML